MAIFRRGTGRSYFLRDICYTSTVFLSSTRGKVDCDPRLADELSVIKRLFEVSLAIRSRWCDRIASDGDYFSFTDRRLCAITEACSWCCFRALEGLLLYTSWCMLDRLLVRALESLRAFRMRMLDDSFYCETNGCGVRFNIRCGRFACVCRRLSAGTWALAERPLVDVLPAWSWLLEFKN